MNVLLVLRDLPKGTPLEYNQMVVTSYSEPTLGDVNLVAEVVTTDRRAPDGSAVFGYANELGVITPLTSIDELVGIFGFDSTELKLKFKVRRTMMELVEGLD